MILVKNVPKCISSPKENGDYFFFDKNGRFIYVWKDTEDENDPIFVIYDTVFNSYVELTSDSSISNNSNIKASIQGPFGHIIRGFFPINVEQMLLILTIRPTLKLLVLVHFDLKQKSYGILDEKIVEKCQQPKIVQDNDVFGLFFITTRDGEITGHVNNGSSKFAFLPFTINSSQIKLGQRQLINYHPPHDSYHPMDFHLGNNKLWFIRNKDIRETTHWLSPRIKHQIPFKPPDDLKQRNLLISYFDVSESNFPGASEPSEVQVSEIKLLKNESISNLHWIKDLVVMQVSRRKFDLFNLSSCEWTEKGIEENGRLNFYNKEICVEERLRKEWTMFQQYNKAYWSEYSFINIDNEFILTAINHKSTTMYRLSLRKPFKLTEIVWTSTINFGFNKKNLLLEERAPCLRVF